MRTMIALALAAGLCVLLCACGDERADDKVPVFQQTKPVTPLPWQAELPGSKVKETLAKVGPTAFVKATFNGGVPGLGIGGACCTTFDEFICYHYFAWPPVYNCTEAKAWEVCRGLVEQGQFCTVGACRDGGGYYCDDPRLALAYCIGPDTAECLCQCWQEVE